MKQALPCDALMLGFSSCGVGAMMGKLPKPEALFYDFEPEHPVLHTHLLGGGDRHVDFGFLRGPLRPLYGKTGRPSVDPELMIRMLGLSLRHHQRAASV